LVLAVCCLLRGLLGLSSPRELRRTGENVLGFVGGLMLATIGSSRFWQGFEIEWGEEIPLFFALSVPTWRAKVPAESASLPGELMWWCGLLSVVCGLWFILVVCRRNWRALGRLIVQGLIIAVCIPIAMVGFRDALPFDERWAERWHMAGCSWLWGSSWPPLPGSFAVV
jgi:hypothetical protein